MRMAKEALWQRYYAAIKAGRRLEAKEILNQIHNQTPSRRSANGGGCGRCKKRFN